ncbi:MAG TPA: hypothetical protein VMU61_11480 [Candidatus Aquilonibacter sp.]|nr:hypothetical protein [Candidatus Aquilonibacter sp.]
MAYEQAAIKVEKEREFAELKSIIERAFLKDSVERFLKQLDGKGIRIRDLEAVLAARALEKTASSEQKAWTLYQALPLSDQAQTREFYLSKLEEVETPLRHRFKKLYQYY